ncbi:MAG: hypothetical protein Q3998_07505 [Porphyromonas sp.]|nr:hypothetical protein [Porphyromonas sp.]
MKIFSSISTEFQRLLGGIVGIYLLLVTVLLLTGIIDVSLFLWQALSMALFAWSVFLLRRMSIVSATIYIVGYQVLLSFALRVIFLSEYGTLFDPQAVDSLLYSRVAVLIQGEDFSQTLRILARHFKGDLSDYGFPIFLKYVYGLSGGFDAANIVLIIFNSIFHAVTALFLYKIAVRVTNDMGVAMWAMGLWGLNTASVFYNISGLKEPLFVMLCSISMWMLYLAKDRGLLKYHLLFLLFAVLLWFFRSYISIFYLIIYIGYCHVASLYNRFFPILVIASIILCLFFASVLVSYFPEIHYSILKNDKFYRDKSFLFQIVSYILAFMAPVPRLADMSYPRDLYIHSLSIVKYLLSIFAMWGCFEVIRKARADFYPLISIVIFTVLLLIVSGRMLEYRYAYITMPSFYILMIYGGKSCPKKLTLGYWLFALVVLFLFNLRGA